MASEGDGMDPISMVVLIIILSVLGYAAYERLYTAARTAQQNALPVLIQDPSSDGPVLVPQR